MRVRFWVAAVLMAVVAVPAASAQTLTKIGALESGASSYAWAVSGDGLIVVGSSQVSAASQYYHAIRWTREGGVEDLGVLEGDVVSVANFITDDGRIIIGHSGPAAGEGRIFRWTSDDGMIELCSGFSATAMNGDGSVLVGHRASGRVCRWTAAEGVVDLDTLPGNPSSEFIALGVSADGGVVVGLRETPTTSGGRPRAVRWTPETGVQDLNPGGEADSWAAAVSADGRIIVGGHVTADMYQDYLAFRWTSETGLQTLAVWPKEGWATAVSPDGSTIVGDTFFWTRQRGHVGLFDYLELGGYTLADTWPLLIQTTDVSADGRTIVGWGFDDDSGESRDAGWVVTIPELCPADYDTNNRVDVQDIFGFLALWFAGDTRADFDGLNGVSISDLFAFLAAWFGGCG